MKKSSFLLGCLLLVYALSFSGCKKCKTCSYKDSTGTSHMLNKFCGNKNDLDLYEYHCNLLANSTKGASACTCK